MIEPRSTSGITIRELHTEEEAHECAELMSNSQPWLTLGRTYEQSVRLLTSPSREVYLALIDGQIIGFIILLMRGTFVGYVQTLAVKPRHRNRGIGASLMEFAEQRILRETPNVFLCVSSFNEAALRFYKRLGYEVVGELTEFVVPGHSEMLLRKSTGPLTEFKAES